MLLCRHKIGGKNTEECIVTFFPGLIKQQVLPFCFYNKDEESFSNSLGRRAPISHVCSFPVSGDSEIVNNHSIILNEHIGER